MGSIISYITQPTRGPFFIGQLALSSKEAWASKGWPLVAASKAACEHQIFKDLRSYLNWLDEGG